jgi:hypothetical protein
LIQIIESLMAGGREIRDRAEATGAQAKSSEWVRPADGSFPGSMLNVSFAGESMREFP